IAVSGSDLSAPTFMVSSKMDGSDRHFDAESIATHNTSWDLIWQSVMWRPGKLRFLIGVKNPLPIDRPRPPENTAPYGARPDARFATPVGLRPPFVTHPATTLSS